MREFLSSYFRQKPGGEPAESVHQMAREYYGTDFPNPNRVDCPPRESFGKLIGEKELPGEDLQNHLFGCSECFNEYRTLLRQASATEVLKKNDFALRLKPLLASGLAAILIALIGGLFWYWKTNSNSLQTARSNNSETVQNVNVNIDDENAETNLTLKTESQTIPAENNTNAEHQTTQRAADKNKRQSTTKKTETLLAKNEIRIDLNNPVWRDSASGEDQKSARLEAHETRLRLKLPQENPQGVYQIFLADEFGRALTEKKNVLVKNRTLSVEFDFRKFSGSQKRLCFAPVGEIPDCVSVEIVAPK